MISANVHDCPLCRRKNVPIWRALCRDCHSLVPYKFRADLLYAYRCRVTDPVRWQERLIEGRQWYLGLRIANEEEEE